MPEGYRHGPTACYVANLPHDIRLSEIEDFFQDYEDSPCKVKDVSFKKGYVFVELGDEKHVEDAVKKLHGTRLNGNLITVQKSLGNGAGTGYRGNDSNQRPQRTKYGLVISNLPLNVGWNDLKIVGRKYGNVTFSDANNTRKGDSWKGKGVLTYSNREDLMKAFDSLKDFDMDGNILDVEYEFPEVLDSDWEGDINNDFPEYYQDKDGGFGQKSKRDAERRGRRTPPRRGTPPSRRRGGRGMSRSPPRGGRFGRSMSRSPPRRRMRGNSRSPLNRPADRTKFPDDDRARSFDRRSPPRMARDDYDRRRDDLSPAGRRGNSRDRMFDREYERRMIDRERERERELSLERRRELRERERRLEERERRLEEERRMERERQRDRSLDRESFDRKSPAKNGNLHNDDGPVIKQIVELRKEDYDKLLEYKERCRELIIENEVLTDKYKKVLELSSAKLKDEMRRKRENNRSPGVKEEARGRLRSRSRTRSLSPRNRNNSDNYYNKPRNYMLADTRDRSPGLRDFSPPRNRRSMSRSRSPARVRSRRESTLSD